MLEAPSKQHIVGGIGCKYCKYWSEYQEDTTKKLLGVSGNWGKCSNPNLTTLLTEKGKQAITHEREKVSVVKNQIADFTAVIISTYETWRCIFFAMLPDKK